MLYFTKPKYDHFKWQIQASYNFCASTKNCDKVCALQTQLIVTL